MALDNFVNSFRMRRALNPGPFGGGFGGWGQENRNDDFTRDNPYSSIGQFSRQTQVPENIPEPEPEMGQYSPGLRMQAYTKHIESMPKQEDYNPSTFRKILAGITGAATGIATNDPEKAYTTSRGIVNQRFDDATQNWNRQGQGLGELADIELKGEEFQAKSLKDMRDWIMAQARAKREQATEARAVAAAKLEAELHPGKMAKQAGEVAAIPVTQQTAETDLANKRGIPAQRKQEEDDRARGLDLQAAAVATGRRTATVAETNAQTAIARLANEQDASRDLLPSEVARERMNRATALAADPKYAPYIELGNPTNPTYLTEPPNSISAYWRDWDPKIAEEVKALLNAPPSRAGRTSTTKATGAVPTTAIKVPANVSDRKVGQAYLMSDGDTRIWTGNPADPWR